MSHSDPMRLHRVSLAIVVVSDVPCEIRGERGRRLPHGFNPSRTCKNYFVAYFDRIGVFEERTTELPIRVGLIRNS